MRNTFLRALLLFVIGSFFYSPVDAQQEDLPPKRELRGVWVATVSNIDFPKKGTPNSVAQKEQWKKLIERLKKNGFNAVFMQVRPAGDAFYESEFIPWSAYLNGKQGQAPVPYYDPMKFMIDITHECGMEFHAWLNPYRATADLDTASLSAWHVFNTHRDWVVRYGTRFYLNPGLPPVRQHINAVVREIVEKYDVDGIHFDDYFYPYKVGNQEFPDSLTFQQYGRRYGSIQDWRRHNVDTLIEQLSQTIKVLKPNAVFGISPFGVWRNRSDDPLGSNTRAGQRSYDDLYADILKWLKNDWIDYVAPQIYWHIGFPVADYVELLNWWRMNSYDQTLLIGHAAYKVADNPDPAWQDPSQIPQQLRLNRATDDVKGSIFFSTTSVLTNPLGLADSLEHRYFNYPALLPTMKQEAAPTPAPPVLKRIRGKQQGVQVKWKWDKSKLNPFLPPDYYVIYRFDGPRVGNLNDPRNILTISSLNGDQCKYLDRTPIENNIYTYVVTAVNRYHMEGPTSESRTVLKGLGKVKQLKNRKLQRAVEQQALKQ